MSSPDRSKAGLRQESKAYSKINARISQAEQEAVAALEELQLRLSAPYVKAQIQNSLQDYFQALHEEWRAISRQWKYSMLKTLERYPLPAAAVGLGLICFQKESANGKKARLKKMIYDIPVPQEKTLLSSHVAVYQQDNHQTDQQRQQMEYVAREKEQAGRQIRHWKEESEPKKEGVATYLHKQVMFARGAFVQRVRHHPLAMGAMMLTVGAVLAAALPRSRTEDQWMGEKRDRFIEAARLQLHSTLKEVKQETGKAVKNLFVQNNHVHSTHSPTPIIEKEIL